MGTFIIVVAALAAAALYSVLLWKRKPTELWPWASGLLATLLSILLGVAVALALFTYTGSQEDAASKARHLRLIKAEMSDTFRILSSDETMNITVGQSTQSVHVAYIQPISIEQAAQSALFDEVTTENLLLLARTMRMYNVKVQYLLAAVASGNSRGTVSHATGNVESTRQALLTDIKLMTKKLNVALSPSINVD